jgi:hypothetical protein
MRMSKNRIGRLLGTLALLGASLGGLCAAGTAPAQAQALTCGWQRYDTSDINGSWGYVGYVEMQYDGCGNVRSHFHIDSSFRANHSGWNVTLYFQNGLTNGEADWTATSAGTYWNTSATDFTTGSVNIWNYPSQRFDALVSWDYNTCSLDQATATHDFAGNYDLSNLIGGRTSGC